MASRYELLLDAFGLRDDHVTANYPWAYVAGYVSESVPTLLVRLPFAAIGYLLNGIPYHVVGRIATFVEDEGDQPATYKLLAGFFCSRSPGRSRSRWPRARRARPARSRWP
jgi:hypothetical protein